MEIAGWHGHIGAKSLFAGCFSKLSKLKQETENAGIMSKKNPNKLAVELSEAGCIFRGKLVETLLQTDGIER